jgi:hypothetical protein
MCKITFQFIWGFGKFLEYADTTVKLYQLLCWWIFVSNAQALVGINNNNLFNIHNYYTGTIWQVSWKQPNTTCQQIFKNAQNNVQYSPFLINIPLL